MNYQEHYSGNEIFEKLIYDLSSSFLHVPDEHIDQEIQRTLRKILGYFGEDRCALLQAQLTDQKTLLQTHAVCADDLNGRLTSMNRGNIVELFPWHFDYFLSQKKPIILKRPDQLPTDAMRDQTSLHSLGLHSIVTVPICYIGSTSYYISFQSMRCGKIWSDDIIPKLRLVGEIIVNGVCRRNSAVKMRMLQNHLKFTEEAMNAGLWSVDLDAGNIEATERLIEMHGVERNDQLHLNIHPDDRRRLEDAFGQAKFTERIQDEYRVMLSDGTVRRLFLRGRAQIDPLMRRRVMLGVSIDVHEKKRIESFLCELEDSVERVGKRSRNESPHPARSIGPVYRSADLVVESAALRHLMVKVQQVAKTDTTVLIQGETGAGKEVVARTIHEMSERRHLPLVTVNCAALPPSLIESELFGRERGAYTGAQTKMSGRFEMANHATLFLDEIGELPIDLQSKLLRVIELGRFERLGSSRSIQVDVRIIAATNRDLLKAVREGKFRLDLFYRLSVFPLEVPPLRDRREDIPLLARFFVKHYEEKLGKKIKTIPQKTMDALLNYHWPGNVRELKNVIENAMIVSHETLHVQVPLIRQIEEDSLDIRNMDRNHIIKILDKTGWRIAGKNGAAELLGLKRTTLQSKMKSLGIFRKPRGAE